MRSIIIIAVLALLVAGVAPKYMERLGASPRPAAQAAAAPQPAPAAAPSTAGPRSVVIQRDGRGHFRTDGTVDGRRIGFMVDTGASAVALRQGDAARLGVHPAQRDYAVQVATANGTVRAAPVTLGMVEVGGVTVRNVAALVIPDEALGENLLGLSFLSRLHRFEYREGRLVLEE
jgi:aspartyl protease family protein